VGNFDEQPWGISASAISVAERLPDRAVRYVVDAGAHHHVERGVSGLK
jgi:hypothetical protein